MEELPVAVEEPVALAKNAAVETDGSDWDEDTKMLAAILGTCLLVGGLMCCYCICLCVWCKAKRKSEASNNWRRRQGDQDRTTDQTNIPIAISGVHAADKPETVAMTSFPAAPAPYEANPYAPTTYGGDYRNPCGGGPSPVLGRPSPSYKNVTTKESKSLILNERY